MRTMFSFLVDPGATESYTDDYTLPLPDALRGFRLAVFGLSPLPLGGGAVVDRGVGEPRLEGGLLPVQPLDLGLGLLGRLAQVGDGGAGLGGGEIGRASCRERVCPYV